MKIYPKNCFDRFGDDLTELILQYLTFEDKIILECVSKKWRRLVYNKQFVIDLKIGSKDMSSINQMYLNVQQLESLLNKCPNIRRVDISSSIKNTSEVLSLIGRYCHRIKSVTYLADFGREDDKCLSFFRMYGHKLEDLYIDGWTRNFEQISQYCPNVEKVLLPDNFNYNFNFLPKLEHVENLIDLYDDNVNKLKILSDKYSQTMKSLNVKFHELSPESLKTCIDCITRFVNLKSLIKSIRDIEDVEDIQPIDDCLSLIDQKCNKLLKLDLKVDYYSPQSERFFQIFSEFKTED